MSTATKVRLHNVDPAAQVDQALDLVDRLEALADVATLKQLAEAYEAMANERMQAAALRDHGDRLLAARKSYAPIAAAANRAAIELKRRGLQLWPGSPLLQPSAADLRRDGGGFLRLARHARDVLAGLASQQ